MEIKMCDLFGWFIDFTLRLKLPEKNYILNYQISSTLRLDC
jgi:hypothetical protein